MSNKAPWIICPACKGEGKIDTQGVVNRDDFDDDSWEMYMEGDYDVTCNICKGAGKVRETDEDGNKLEVFRRTGSNGQNVYYDDLDDASEHWLRMAEGLC